MNEPKRETIGKARAITDRILECRELAVRIYGADYEKQTRVWAEAILNAGPLEGINNQVEAALGLIQMLQRDGKWQEAYMMPLLAALADVCDGKWKLGEEVRFEL